ncbi:MAG: AMP-dependent synthetase [Gammaproteobacteria bacterium SG8_11]|nr:MAG: AMP-dependent synthetase [Gammaproteobacteria bacterium SG8_11]
MFKTIIRWLLKVVYRVEITGAENLQSSHERTLVVANHTSFLDALLLFAYLPMPATFAMNTYIARSWIGRLAALFGKVYAMDPSNPLSIRSLIRRVEQGECIVIFPEGRITVTGALMKVYAGPGLVADRSKATVLPIRIDGAQYTPFSRLRGRVRRRWFPKITLNVQPPRRLQINEKIRGRQRREQAGRQLTNLMTELMYQAANQNQTLVERLLDARRIHGGRHVIAEDINRSPLTYNALITRSVILGCQLVKHCGKDETVGVLLPNALATVATFWGLQLYGRVPAMLNYTVGAQGMISACETAVLRRVITSRRFVEQAKLDDVVQALSERVELIYLEDIAQKINLFDKVLGLIKGRMDSWLRHLARRQSTQPAVILFTSGSEGTPKGVVLSHRNVVANIHQLLSRIDFNPQDVALNALPLFHSFGLTAGMVLPLTSGVRVFFYPSPLHYRVVPEVAYEINATLLFGTNTFLAGYARVADDYDFYSVRYVFAGAEKLQEEVRRTWQDKFGVRIFEGYGATETSPVIAGNTPLAHRAGTVGRMMPGMEYHLVDVPGLEEGQRLQVRGPNVMLGYLLHDNPGVLVPPVTELGEGWYDTGDIVTIDSEGFIRICGRAKRFAKVAGEMVSLTSVEVLASETWPEALHAAVAIPDVRKGEQVVLLTTVENADRSTLSAIAQQKGIAEISVPRRILPVNKIPVLGTGKIDYVAAGQMVEAMA